MGTLRSLDQLDVVGKRVLVRVDFNVPMKNGSVANDARIREAAGTLTELIDKGAGVVVASHMGRPKGQVVADLSLEPLTAVVQSYVPNAKVSFCGATDLAEVRRAAAEVQAGELLIIENLRFYPGEEQNDAD
ncbi:MAG: phosphoglycerate kinase, partial [Rhodospirillaceae bacterium]